MRMPTHPVARRLAMAAIAVVSIVVQDATAVVGLPMATNKSPECINPLAHTCHVLPCLDSKARFENSEGARWRPEKKGLSGIVAGSGMLSVRDRTSSNTKTEVACPLDEESRLSFVSRTSSAARAAPLLSMTVTKPMDGRKRAILTFDDGPSSTYTPEILDILKDEGVHAVFFVVGSQAESRPHLLSRMAAEGHEIGNHTYSHLDPASATYEELVCEIRRTSEIVEQATGSPTTWLRPPGGVVSPEVISAAESTGHNIVLWNVDTRDWRVAKQADADRLVAEAVANATASQVNIVLMHDGGGQRNATVSALRSIIQLLRDNGYEICSLAELVGATDDGKASPSPIWTR